MADIFDAYLSVTDDFNSLSNARRPKVYKNRWNPLQKLSDHDFKRKYRFNKSTVRKIIEIVKPDLGFDNRGGKISAELQVLSAIRYWARDEIQDDCADIHGFSQQTLSIICKRVAKALSGKCRNFIKMPTSVQEQESVILGFQNIGQFPGVIGCIDCTHIKIKKIGGDVGQFYINRKGYYSLNVQVICDHKLKIRDIVAHWRGSAHDSRIFTESTIKERFEEREFHGRLLGDAGYACTSYLFTPVRNPTNVKEENFNKSHIKTRNTIERCFGVWKQRFRCLQRGMLCSLETTKLTIVALAVLHNIAIEMNDLPDTENTENSGDNPPESQAIEIGGIGAATREIFINRHF